MILQLDPFAHVNGSILLFIDPIFIIIEILKFDTFRNLEV